MTDKPAQILQHQRRFDGFQGLCFVFNVMQATEFDRQRLSMSEKQTRQALAGGPPLLNVNRLCPTLAEKLRAVNLSQVAVFPKMVIMFSKREGKV